MIPSPTLLRRRAQALAAIRRFFEAAGSIEVETPAIVRCPGVDAHIDAVPVQVRAGGPDATPAWLTTSPELHMKRLLVAGSGPIHQLGKAFRDGERGRLHEPEFTLLEWYVPGADDAALMDQTEALVRVLAEAFGDGGLRRGGGVCRAGRDGPPFERLPFRDAFRLHAGVDPVFDPPARLGRALRAAGLRIGRDATRDELIDLLLSLVVGPALGVDRPCFVTDWPVDRAALARVREGREGPVAARFELFACGLELCNGFWELADPLEHRLRWAEENRQREADGRPPHPPDEAFLSALEDGLPACAGNALGVDRLLMLLFGAESLAEVRPFLLDIG